VVRDDGDVHGEVIPMGCSCQSVGAPCDHLKGKVHRLKEGWMMLKSCRERGELRVTSNRGAGYTGAEGNRLSQHYIDL